MARRATVILVTIVLWVGVVGLFLVFLTSAAGREGAGLGFGPRVAVVELEGLIVDVRHLLEDLRAHRENPAVRAVVIRINSPGGVVAPTQELARAIHRLRDAGKPVVASFGAVAASGGYYVAVATDRIYANPGTLTGSIGVVSGKLVTRGLRERLGITTDEAHRGANALMFSRNQRFTESQWERVAAFLDRVYDEFVRVLKDKTEKIAIGDPLEKENWLGPVIDGRGPAWPSRRRSPSRWTHRFRRRRSDGASRRARCGRCGSPLRWLRCRPAWSSSSRTWARP